MHTDTVESTSNFSYFGFLLSFSVLFSCTPSGQLAFFFFRFEIKKKTNFKKKSLFNDSAGTFSSFRSPVYTQHCSMITGIFRVDRPTRRTVRREKLNDSISVNSLKWFNYVMRSVLVASRGRQQWVKSDWWAWHHDFWHFIEDAAHTHVLVPFETEYKSWPVTIDGNILQTLIPFLFHFILFSLRFFFLWFFHSAIRSDIVCPQC